MSRAVADNDQQLFAFDALGGEVQPKRFNFPRTSKMGGKCARPTAGSQQILQASSHTIFACYILVRLHAYDEGNVLTHQKCQSFQTDKLTICQKIFDTGRSKQIKITRHQRHALTGVTVAGFAQNRPDLWHSIAACGDGQNQKIDILATDLPIRAVKT